MPCFDISTAVNNVFVVIPNFVFTFKVLLLANVEFVVYKEFSYPS